ncbi:MAG: hypothetical protein AAFZ38_10450 [Myxococcota bacterium]
MVSKSELTSLTCTLRRRDGKRGLITAWSIGCAIFSGWSLACDDALPVAEETPERAFVLNGVNIDDQQPDGSRWQGRAQRARGSLDESDFEQIRIVITGAEQQRSYVIEAPRGTMNFETRRGVFQDMVVTDEDGGVVRAGVGHYDGEAGTLSTDGPMALESNGIVVDAPRAVIDLETGAMDVQGPIQGRYQATDPTASPPAPREP